MLLEVSNGEVVDKYTILQLKAKHATDASAIEYINAELKVVASAVDTIVNSVTNAGELKALTTELGIVNAALWNIEDQLRAAEKNGRWDAKFIFLARRVYQLNDVRAQLKRDINELTNSKLVEVKVYA